MNFPANDPAWGQVLAYLQERHQPGEALWAPSEFLPFFPETYDLTLAGRYPVKPVSWVVLHKDWLPWLERGTLEWILSRYEPVFANEVFVLYSRQRRLSSPLEKLVAGLRYWVRKAKREDRGNFPDSGTGTPRTALVILTYNRPWALERSLPQLMALKRPIIVVNDGSFAEHTPGYAAIRQRFASDDLTWLDLPENTGLVGALHIGLNHWLADPQVEWISLFQDDVDVHPDLLDVLARVQDSRLRPLLAGRISPEHPVLNSAMMGEERVYGMRAISGQHLHAHRDYWQAVLPVRMGYRGWWGKGRSAGEDCWISAWADDSIVKKGGFVTVVPDLVRTFANEPGDSTWNNRVPMDPPLKGGS